MRTLTNIALSLVLAVMLSGCATYQVRTFKPSDKTDKTVLIQPYGDQVREPIKSAMRDLGWDVYTAFTSNPVRYEINIDINGYNQAGQFWYDINMVDRTTGKDVVSVSGKSEPGEAKFSWMKAVETAFK